MLGEVVLNAVVLNPKTLANMDEAQFARRLKGQHVDSIRRRGKFLRILFEKDQLVIHLRMSGDIRVETESEAALLLHDRLYLDFESGKRMVLNDTRKFARSWLLPVEAKMPAELGPEPLDEMFTAKGLHDRLNKSKRAIKAVLLDQSVLAGVGNIYSDESLFLAGIDPRRAADTLSLEDTQRLLEAIRKVLKQGILTHGASIDWVYRGGDFQNHFNVYQRKGESCKVCGNPIERTVVGQRGTHFCPHCQK